VRHGDLGHLPGAVLKTVEGVIRHVRDATLGRFSYPTFHCLLLSIGR
jgi:hypothetical protein